MLGQSSKHADDQKRLPLVRPNYTIGFRYLLPDSGMRGVRRIAAGQREAGGCARRSAG
jgi:hypothetical protein